MKMISAVFCLSSLFLTVGWASDKKFVNPGDEYENDTENTTYLLLVLKPCETFENNSGKTFKVLEGPEDFLEFSKELKIDFMIETASVSVGSKIDSLNKLEQDLESEEAKLKDVEKKK